MSFSRGVSILVHKTLSFACKQVQLAKQDRCIFLHTLNNNVPCVLANVYVPPLYTSDVLYCFLLIQIEIRMEDSNRLPPAV